MRCKLKTLLMEIIVEALFGQKFPIKLTKNGHSTILTGMASANARQKSGERPYRITWFTSDFMDNRHVDLELEEVMNILNIKTFPPDIVQRVKDRYPDSDLIGDSYEIQSI